ncbi:MAG: hypothetical protein AB7F21_12565 [Desulfuromonadales bacterium]|jgi:uncharacterized protein YjgD (DUF1641 family)
MASNQDKNVENYHDFMRWLDGKNLEDLLPYTQKRKNGNIRKHKIALAKINNELDMGSSFVQNGLIRKKIDDLEISMRANGLLDPDETIDDNNKCTESVDPGTHQSRGSFSSTDAQRLRELEEENAYLREELKAKEKKLKRHGLIDSFLSDTMRWPR